ncbi:MAG: hypothetical protein E7357_07920 [Clostridiales bacterium]|nr:hypothetical protein [Clostridiales bacterium]
MRSTKKLGLIVSSAVLAFGFSVAGVQATATGEQATTGSNYFNFENGAAVRLVDDGLGEAIRFQSVIGKDYYNNLVAEYTDGETVTLKSKVSDAANENRYLTMDWVLIGDNALNMTFTAKQEANFYHAISFEDLFQNADADDIKEAVALDLKAEMYIEVSDGVNDPVKLTATNEVETVTRSARTIANEAYDTYADETSDKYNTDKAARVAKYFKARTEVTEDIYFEAGETLSPVLAKGVADTFDFASAKVYAYKDTLAGALPTATTFGETLGSKAAVSFTLFDSNNNVLNVNAENAMYVTKALKTEADLKVFDVVDDDDNLATEVATAITGYYVLANNIENDADVLANRHDGLQRQSGTERADKISNLYYNGDAGFYGVFDGQGYTMAFDVYQGGLFGRLQPGALIKNVGMDITFESDTVASAGIIAYSALKSTSAANAVTIQDVYVNVDDFRTANNSSGTALLVYPKPHVYLTRVVMNIGDVVCDENTRASGALYVADTSRGTDSGKKSQVLVISKTPMFMSMDDNWTSNNRDQRQVAVTDVVEMTKNAVDSDATNNGKLALAIGTNVQGTALSERSIDATGGVYCLLNTFRFNSVADMASAFTNQTKFGNDGVSGYAVGNLSNFKAVNGWDTSSGAPVWATFNK